MKLDVLFFFAFRVTVAQGYKEYWVKSPGPVVSQNDVAPPPQTTFSGSIGAQTTTSSILSHSVSQTMLKLLKWQFTHCHEFVTLSVSKQLEYLNNTNKYSYSHLLFSSLLRAVEAGSPV